MFPDFPQIIWLCKKLNDLWFFLFWAPPLSLWYQLSKSCSANCLCHMFMLSKHFKNLLPAPTSYFNSTQPKYNNQLTYYFKQHNPIFVIGLLPICWPKNTVSLNWKSSATIKTTTILSRFQKAVYTTITIEGPNASILKLAIEMITKINRNYLSNYRGAELAVTLSNSSCSTRAHVTVDCVTLLP